MNFLVLDFETFFSDDFTLKKLTTEAYIRDPHQFEVHLCGFYEPATKRRRCVGQANIPSALERIDWSNTAVLCHHAQFDGLILSHVYGVVPAMWFDTLSMARLMLGNHVSVSLDNLAKHYGLAAKSVPYQAFKGRRWINISDELRTELGEACLHDCELTYQIFRELAKGFPQEEYHVIDATIRMFTEPQLVGDQALFERLKLDEWTSKQTLLADLGVTEKDLQSSAKFATLLDAEGVEVEMKEGKNGKIPAVAATDAFMRDLATSPDPRVAALATARLEVRSTIDETRAGRLASMASRGPMSVYLSYCGAQTLRWSGGDKVNFQNMRRGSELRKGLSAPNGYLLAIIDLSQIEARLLAYLAGQDDLVETFRAGADPYIGIASEFYGETITKEDKARRGLGKLLVLSCGYGSGGSTIVKTAAKGTYGPPLQLTEAEGLQARDTYRAKNPAIVQFWRECDLALKWLNEPLEEGPIPWAHVTVRSGAIEMPNGARMLYDLEWDAIERSWQRKTRSGRRKIWGGVLAQNLCEAFGRLLISQAMVRIGRAGFKTVLTTHDEIVVLVPDTSDASNRLGYLMGEVTLVPDYLLGLPLAAEGHLSKSYDK